jgi:hypothetical protein
LGLGKNEGKLVQLGEGILGRSGRFFLDRILVSLCRSRLTSLRLLWRGERDKEVDCGDLARDDLGRGQIPREVTKDLLQSFPFLELVLDHRFVAWLLDDGLVERHLQHLIVDTKEIIPPVGRVKLVRQALLGILQPLLKVLVLLTLFLWCAVDEPVRRLDLIAKLVEFSGSAANR